MNFLILSCPPVAANPAAVVLFGSASYPRSLARPRNRGDGPGDRPRATAVPNNEEEVDQFELLRGW
jgi:hypothetical protein